VLYASTRSNAASYTARRALMEDRAPDGGLFVPAVLPVYEDENLAALLQEPPSEIVARIINDFFDAKLRRLDVEFALGRKFFGMARLNQRTVVGELWRNSETSFEGLCRRMNILLRGDMDSREPGLWMRIACRIALLFAAFAKLRSGGVLPPGQIMDTAVLTGSFEGPYALWVARKMGLPVGEIICCCNENNGIWDLFNRGQMRLGGRPLRTQTPKCDITDPVALELLIHGVLQRDDVERYFAARSRGAILYLGPDQHRRLRAGFYAAVVSDKRMSMAIANLYKTNGYILCPYSALVYMGLLDYHSHPGPRRPALLLTEHDPRENAQLIVAALETLEGELPDLTHSV